jgi:hypothetical protein
MSDDESLRRLLSDAVADVEPRDRLGEIRASVRPDPKVVPMARTRPWLYAVSGAVASAAVIGVIAYTTSALAGPDHSDSPIGAGHPTRSRAPATSATATDSSALPTKDDSPTATAPTGSKVYAVYYVGNNGSGRTVLFREFHRGPQLPTTDPTGNGADLLTQALRAAIATPPLDPDYRSPWAGLATLDSASYETTGEGHTLQVSLSGKGLATRPPGMTANQARIAVQQLVYTAQAALGKREPVAFTIGRHAAGGQSTLLGVDIAQPVSNDSIYRTLSLVNISSPNEGDTASGELTVTGVNNSFEGSSVISLERNGREYLPTPTIGGFGGTKLYPWTVTLDLSKVTPGEYTVVASNDDPSGQGHPDVDTRTITVK